MFKHITKLTINLAIVIIVILLGYRLGLNLTHIPNPEWLRVLTQLLLSPFPGRMSGVDLGISGLDIQAVIGVLVYLNIYWIVNYVIYKIWRKNLIQVTSGLLDVWAGAMLITVFFGFMLTWFGLDMGSSIWTDACISLISLPTRYSVISDPYLMGLFIATVVLLINILLDLLLERKFPDSYTKIYDHKSISIMQLIFANRLNELKSHLRVDKTLQEHKEVLEQESTRQDTKILTRKDIVKWEEWTKGLFHRPERLTHFIES